MTILLPLVISLWVASTIVREKKTGMQNIVCLPIRSDRVWAGKASSIVLQLSVSSLLMWAVTTVIGLCTVMYISPIDGLIGCFLLLLSYYSD